VRRRQGRQNASFGITVQHLKQISHTGSASGQPDYDRLRRAFPIYSAAQRHVVASYTRHKPLEIRTQVPLPTAASVYERHGPPLRMMACADV